MIKPAIFASALLLFSTANLKAEDPFVFQNRLSKLPTSGRLSTLEKELNPSKSISAKEVNNWQRDLQFQKCLQDEGQYLEIENQIIGSLRSALKSRSFKKLKKVTRNNFSWPKTKSYKKHIEVEGMVLFKTSEKMAASPSVEKSFLNDYTSVEAAEVEGVFYEVKPGARGPKNLNFQSATVRLKFDVRGMNRKKQRMNDRGLLEVLVAKAGSKWVVTKGNILEAERVLLKRKPAFVEKTVAKGLSKIRTHERSEAIRRGGYTLVVDDLNSDGILDIFSGSAQESQLLMGQKGGGWKPKKSELEEYKAVKTAVFADFDNDGDKDSIMTLFEYDRDASDIVYLRNDEGRFKKIKNFIQGKLKYNLPMPASVADFNKDGLLDVYVGFPGKQDFTTLDADMSKENNPQGLFTNIGKASDKKVFKDVTKAFWGESGLAQYTSLYPHSSLAIDYDFDGDSDLLVIDDRSNLSPLYENTDGKGFKMLNDAVNYQNKGYGMGVAVGDLNNDGINEIALTNVNFNARKRFHSSCNQNWYFDFPQDKGFRLFSGKKSKVTNKITYTEVTEVAGLGEIGEGGAGLEFFDYNNDGLLDIYVTNGLWSGESREKKHDLSSLFVRAVAAKKTFDDVLAPNRVYRKKDWSFISILRDRDLPITKSMAGFQRNRLFLNLGNMEFAEVGYLEGVDSEHDGYIVANADINNDGKMDLILRNGDPGTAKYEFPTVQYYENNLAKKQNSIIISLKGVESNSEAIGAVVKVRTIDDKTLVRQLVANNGPAQSERIVHFGIGRADAVKSVNVHWPSGKIQEMGPLKKGRYHLVEGGHEKVAKAN